MASLFGGTEKALSDSSMMSPMERNYSDKVLGKEEINKLELLVQKDILTAQDLRQMSYLLNAMEIKLVNFSDKTRYYCGKYTIWINSAFSIAIEMLQNMDMIEKGQHYSDLTKTSFTQSYIRMDKKIKEMVGIYLYFIRSSLSLGSNAFEALTTNRIDQQYHAYGLPGGDLPKPQGTSIFNFGRGKAA